MNTNNIYSSGKLLTKDDNFQILFEEGDNSCEAIISFTGIGKGLGGIQKQEFQSTFAGTRDIYYVIDSKRSWYSSCKTGISNFISNHINNQGYKNITTIGNSMGGSGAIYFANLLENCFTSIAFVPQSSIDPSVASFEKRYIEFSRGYESASLINFTAHLSPKVTYHIVVGTENNIDVCHSKRFYEALPSNCHLYQIPGADHNVAQFIKKNGYSLRDLISSMGQYPSESNDFMDKLIRNIANDA